MKKFTSATATRRFGLMLLLVIASVSVANAQLQRTLVALGELPNPIFPTAPFQLREVEVKLAPGAVGPWHWHPGPAQIIVKQGTFRLTQDEPGCPEVDYQAGDVAIELNGPEGSAHIHRPSNPDPKEETIIYITFTLPPGTPPDQDLIPAQPQFCGQ